MNDVSQFCILIPGTCDSNLTLDPQHRSVSITYLDTVIKLLRMTQGHGTYYIDIVALFEIKKVVGFHRFLKVKELTQPYLHWVLYSLFICYAFKRIFACSGELPKHAVVDYVQ